MAPDSRIAELDRKILEIRSTPEYKRLITVPGGMREQLRLQMFNAQINDYEMQKKAISQASPSGLNYPGRGLPRQVPGVQIVPGSAAAVVETSLDSGTNTAPAAVRLAIRTAGPMVPPAEEQPAFLTMPRRVKGLPIVTKAEAVFARNEGQRNTEALDLSSSPAVVEAEPIVEPVVTPAPIIVPEEVVMTTAAPATTPVRSTAKAVKKSATRSSNKKVPTSPAPAPSPAPISAPSPTPSKKTEQLDDFLDLDNVVADPELDDLMR